MQIVIDIPEEIYERCRKFELHCGEAEVLEGAVATGTPLPKRHGRIGDLDRLYQVFERNVVGGVFRQLFDMAPTIIEADEEGE